MAKKPFKKYNAKQFVEAVRLTRDNISEVAGAVGGIVIVNETKVAELGDLRRLELFDSVHLQLPTLDGVKLVSAAGDAYVYYDNGRVNSMTEDEFEELYVVGQDRLWREAKAAEIGEGTDNG